LTTSSEPEALQFDPDELEEMLGRALSRSAAISTAHRRRRTLTGGVAVALAVVALAATVAVETEAPNASPRSAQSPLTHQGGGSVSPQWRLVSDVSASWQVLPGPGGGSGPQFDMTCPSVTTCYALGMTPKGPPKGASGPKPSQSSLPVIQIETTTDSGEIWTAVNLPVSASQASLSCVSTSTCALLGLDSTGGAVFLMTSDGGQTWSSQRAPSQLRSTGGFVSAFDCVSPRSCTAVVASPDRPTGTPAGFSFTTSDGGQTWTRATLPGGLVPGGLACTDGGDCAVTGYNPAASAGDAGGAAAAYSIDGGVTWTAATLPAGTNPLHSVACTGSGFCITSEFGGSPRASILTSSDGGVTWTAVSTTGLPSNLTPPKMGTNFSCPTTTDCWISGVVVPPGDGGTNSLADAQGVLAQSADGGHTWQPAQLPDTVGMVMSVACPTATACYAMAIIGTGSGQQTFGFLSDNALAGG
jgi:hypothetical protein